MTARADRARRMGEAAVAARAADSWIGAQKRIKALATVIGEPNARVHGPALLSSMRLSRRFPAYATALTEAIVRRPALGDFLASPDRLQRLALFAGAGLVGGGMVRFVNRRSVAELVAALGEDVWQYGIAHGGSPIKAVRDEDDMIDRIASDGTRAVHAYLDAIAPGLGTDAFDAAGIAIDRSISPQEQDAALASVDGALELVQP